MQLLLDYVLKPKVRKSTVVSTEELDSVIDFMQKNALQQKQRKTEKVYVESVTVWKMIISIFPIQTWFVFPEKS